MSIVVSVPQIMFNVTGGRPRRIYLECFDVLDRERAKKEAFALGEIMKERIFTVKKREPKIQIAKPL